jgi:hypothetical protein
VATLAAVIHHPLGWRAPTIVTVAYVIALLKHRHPWLYGASIPRQAGCAPRSRSRRSRHPCAVGHCLADPAVPSVRFGAVGVLAAAALTFPIASVTLPLSAIRRWAWQTLATCQTLLNALRVAQGMVRRLLLLPLLVALLDKPSTFSLSKSLPRNAGRSHNRQLRRGL